MECNFVVGQKVCATVDFDGKTITKGKIVTIKSIKAGKYAGHDGVANLVCLKFYEVIPTSPNVGFDARYFRPVSERKADISCFTSLLNPNKLAVKA